MAFLAAVPPVAGAVDAGREGGLAMRLTELLDGLWRWATGRLYEGCEEVTVSGHRFCLPRDRVVIWRKGAYHATVKYYLNPLPGGKKGRHVLFGILDARRIGTVPDGMTVPEFNLRSLIRARTRDDKERAVLWEEVKSRIARAKDEAIIDVSDLFGHLLTSSTTYFQVQQGRVVRFVDCSASNQYYKNDCVFVSHYVGDWFFLRYWFLDNFENLNLYFKRALSIEHDFRSLLGRM